MSIQFYDNLSNDLTQLLESGVNYDVSIEVEDTLFTKIYKVHSIILQTRSPYFKKKFNEITFTSIQVLKLPNIYFKVFEIIIKYIYSGKIYLEKIENSVIFDLLITSNELELDELVQYLQNYLVKNKDYWLRLNFARVYKTNYQFKNLKVIQEFCNETIAKYPNIIFEAESFCPLPEDTLIAILKRDDLQLSEGEIWEYVIQWGKAKNPTLPINIENWTSDNFLSLKTTLKQCLPHIRYFNISGEDVLEKLFPYQKILEPKLWLDINTKIMAPNKPISSRILPSRILPSRMILTSSEGKSSNHWARVLHNYNAANGDELSLNEGELIRDIIEVIGGWWKGTSEDGTRTGLFPINFVEFIDRQNLTGRYNENNNNGDPTPEKYEVERQVQAMQGYHQAISSFYDGFHYEYTYY
ncbi:hypothetical protein Glove_21g383 [Diversispora epigaea]|uniref:SH3 domain-containing protein n=1 Tax=Diversispora epigaea TaxID=1348612 RepID=A0A397JS80_9GLOM|nr:hypothetical protein Glove_21g383 [Diversispora epigaea]